ncbi:hypothetical protein EIZ62_28490 [Streptomyces ficellus]|uniref:Uncharacterized protein n=1 Tax=Streptomyces ficellus TaxID=1977088 RepID=A0A6I6FN68_9ACTN|nr:hypothetical protein EIZ62_28490 [Streptomyces ficellus]
MWRIGGRVGDGRPPGGDRAHGAPSRWLEPSAITRGYYAHFMPEAGGKGRGVIDGLRGERGVRPAGRTPQVPLSVVDRRFPPLRPAEVVRGWQG